MNEEENNFDFSLYPGRKLNEENTNVDYSANALVSIVTPFYNSYEFIEQTANSVFNQTFPFWEWIIVNDGSTDKKSLEVLKDLEKKDARIKVVDKDNSGPAASRYLGVKNAKADIVFILDSDDLIINTMLECGYFTLFTNKEATWAYTDSTAFGKRNYLWNSEFDTFKEKKSNLVCGNCFIRRDKFLEINEYATLPKEVHEDWFMWLSFLAKGYFPIRMSFYGFWYRTSDKGRLKTISKDKEKSAIAEEYINKIKKNIKTKVKALQFPASNDYSFSSYPKNYDGDIQISRKGKSILLLLPWAVTGGADIFNLDLVKGLKERGYNIYILTTEKHIYSLRQQFEEYCTAFFDLNTFLKKEDWPEFISYIIKSRNIDLVFTSNSYYSYHVIPWLKNMFPKLPFVDYLHAQDWSWRDGGYPKDSIAVEEFFDRTYTCTKYLEKIMYEDMKKTKKNTKVVYIGTDTQKYDPNYTDSEYEMLKNKFAGKKVVLFPCRVEYLKRPYLMLKICNKIKEKRENVVFVVVGDGKALSFTKNRVKKMKLQNDVFFVGMQKDLRPYYKIADVTLVCSLTEGLTLTAYESLSMGVPVVSSDVGGQKELIDDKCGKIINCYQNVEKDLNNYEYSVEEINDYVTAIIDILDNKDYDLMSKYCRAKMVKEFSLDNMQEKMCEDFDSIIKNGTNVEFSKCNNRQFAERYLILFNEIVKSTFLNLDDPIQGTFKKRLANKLWKFAIYRNMVLILSKRKNK